MPSRNKYVAPKKASSAVLRIEQKNPSSVGEIKRGVVSPLQELKTPRLKKPSRSKRG